MKNKNMLFRKGLVCAILVLFIGAGVIPSMGNSIVVRHDLQENKTTFTNRNSRGYIQDLIDNASDGDTIFIPSGTYYENIIIDKRISLIGEDKKTTVIDGGHGIVVSIVVDWVNISGFTIQNIGGNAGIKIISNHATIIGNSITSWSVGIRLESSSNNIITGNNVTEGGTIFLYKSSDNIITDNNITTGSIWLYYSSGTNISGNTMVGSGKIFIDGYKLEHWNTQVIDTSNTVYGKPVIYWKNQIGGTIPTDAGQVILANCTDVVVENQNISGDGARIQLGFSSGCTITGNHIINNEWECIWLEYSNDNNITNNDGGGIYLEGSNGNNIISNDGGDAGITLCEHSDNNIVTGNNIINSEWEGIYVYYYSDNNIIADNNIISNDEEGIHIQLSSSNTVTNNTITNNNKDGICFSGENNNIVGNSITNNGGHGITMNGESNTISGNNISNNANGIYFVWYTNDDNIITNNNITNNIGCGIYIQSAIGNIITGNTVSGNQFGINCSDKYSYYNIFYHNNFIDNIDNAYDEGYNTWDDGKYGNYWSDYEDRYPDAKPRMLKPWMWNTPYEIGGRDNKDNCPLIKQWPNSKSKSIPGNQQNSQQSSSQLFFKIVQNLLNIR